MKRRTTFLSPLVLVTLLVIFKSPVLFALEAAKSCGRFEIESLRDQLECDESKNPSSCASVGLALAGSVSAIRFGSLHTIGTHKVDVRLLELNKSLIEDVQKVSQQAQRDARSFTKALSDAIQEQKKLGVNVKIPGFNPMKDRLPTWSQLYSAYKDQVDSKIPGNPVAKKMASGVTPENYITSQIQAVTTDRLKDLPVNQKPTFLKYKELEQLRFREDFKKLQARSGNTIEVKGLESYSTREDTARELTQARRGISAFKALQPRSCGTFAKHLAVAAGVGTAAQIASGATVWATVENCAKDFQVHLTESDKMFLIEAANSAQGASRGFSCDQLSLSSMDIENFLSSEKNKFSPELQTFLCRLEEKKNSLKLKNFNRKKEIQIACNSLSVDGVRASMVQGSLEMILSSGIKVRLPSSTTGRWTYEGIQSSDPQLQDFLQNKVRHPMVSSSAKSQVLSPDYACNSSSKSAQWSQLCEASQALETWNHFSQLAESECSPSPSSEP